MLKGSLKERWKRLFTRAYSNSGWLNTKKGYRFRLDIRKEFFTMRLVRLLYRENRNVGNALFMLMPRLFIREKSMVLNSKTIYILVFPTL